MKNKIIFVLICIVALILGLNSDVNNIVTFIVKPFSILGEALRNLSLNSGFGNILSILLFILISLIPIFILIRMIILKKAKILDYILLTVISVFTFLSIYGYINPHILFDRFDVHDIIDPSIEGYDLMVFIVNAFYVYILCLLIGIYLVLKMHKAKNINIVKVFSRVIDVLIVIYLFGIFFVNIPAYINGLSEDLTSAVIGLQFIETLSSLAAYVFMILILFNLKSLIKFMGQNEFHEESLIYSKKLYKLSIISLIVILSMQILYNLYQVVFISSIPDVSASIYLPMDTLFLSVTFFFLGKYLTKVNELNEEHNLIV